MLGRDVTYSLKKKIVEISAFALHHIYISKLTDTESRSQIIGKFQIRSLMITCEINNYYGKYFLKYVYTVYLGLTTWWQSSKLNSVNLPNNLSLFTE